MVTITSYDPTLTGACEFPSYSRSNANPGGWVVTATGLGFPSYVWIKLSGAIITVAGACVISRVSVSELE